MQLRSGSVTAAVAAERGGRLASLAVDGRELLVTEDDDPLRWGSYPMVPFAGRIRHGQFRWAGRLIELPRNLGPHAIHGYGYTSPWAPSGPNRIAYELSAPWPFAGTVVQEFDLAPDRLTITMRLEAHEEQPAMLGWHPWFRRRLAGSDPAVIGLAAASMYELDAEAIPTGRLVDPPPGPWDNCFTDLAMPPTVTWGGAIELTLTSSCDHWVVFDEPRDALCVEPQTGAPDEVNRAPRPVAAGESLEASFTLAWR